MFSQDAKELYNQEIPREENKEGEHEGEVLLSYAKIWNEVSPLKASKSPNL